MNVETSAGSTGADSLATHAGAPLLEDDLVQGRRWQAVGCRRDGRHTVVTVVSRVGALRVEIEDVGSGKRKTIQVASLVTNYQRLPGSTPPAHQPQVAKGEEGTSTVLDVEFRTLACALTVRSVAENRTTTIEWNVTPALAEALLRNNTRNRAPSLKVVTLYARDYARNNWSISHQGLALGPTWELGDGAHRCLAIVKSGVTVRMVVTWYRERRDFEAARRTWDSGRKRTKANVLELSGLVPRGQGKHKAALLQAVSYLDGRYPIHPTNEDMVGMYDVLLDHLDAVAELSPSEFLAPTRAAFLIAHRVAPKEVEACIRLVSTKVGLEHGTPVHALVLKLPELQKTKGHHDRAGLMKDVLTLLYKHVKGEPGVTVIKQHTRAYQFFLGEHFREASGR